MFLGQKIKEYLFRLKTNKGQYDGFPNSIGINVSRDFKIGQYRNIQILSYEKIEIKTNIVFREFCNILVMGKATLEIGKNVFFNNYCSINCLDNIKIGENTQFGEGVKIYDHNHKYSYENNKLNVDRNKFNTAPVIIGSNCWIGSNVTILKGVTIGDNTIIGAGNLIYKSIPPGAIIKLKADSFSNEL